MNFFTSYDKVCNKFEDTIAADYWKKYLEDRKDESAS